MLTKAVEQRNLKREVESLKKLLVKGQEVKPLVGNSPGIVKVYETLNAIKDSESSVLIYGETGTGKELVAQSHHFNSNRRDKPPYPGNS